MISWSIQFSTFIRFLIRFIWFLPYFIVSILLRSSWNVYLLSFLKSSFVNRYSRHLWQFCFEDNSDIRTHVYVCVYITACLERLIALPVWLGLHRRDSYFPHSKRFVRFFFGSVRSRAFSFSVGLFITSGIRDWSHKFRNVITESATNGIFRKMCFSNEMRRNYFKLWLEEWHKSSYATK